MAIDEVLAEVDPTRKSLSESRMKEVKRKCAVTAKGGGKPDLMDVRVVQRRLVYAVGLSADICSDQVLKSTDYFGKYGKIKKISVTWSNHASPARQATAAAYVLFLTEEDAWNCIQAIDGVKWSGKQVRACFGTTKYCHAYLRNAACTNAECSYLHEPAPEEDTVTKEEMNPMTGRKEVLQLVYPGGVPRGVSKISYKGARGATVLPARDSSPPPPTDSATQTPSKTPPAWAIPAPGSKEALVADMLEGSRDVSPDSSPQFVIPTAAPAAWPSLTEIASSRAESLLSRASSGTNGLRPSAKDVVTGCAAASKPKEVPKKTMMPLAVAGGKSRSQRLASAKDSGLLSPPDSKVPESEHALSTMPSSELSSSRARLDTSGDGALERTTSPPAMALAPLGGAGIGSTESDHSGASVEMLAADDAESTGEGSADADKENTADSGDAEVFTPRSAPTVDASHGAVAVRAASPAGADPGSEAPGALSARDLLPASLEDILEDPVADVQPRAASENGGVVEKKGADVPRPSLDSHVVMPARRKQSRFAFATTPAGKGSSMSLPHDLDSMNAPAVAPEALLGQAAAQEARSGDGSPARVIPQRPLFDKNMLPDDLMQAIYVQQEQPNAAAIAAAAAAATAAANARMHAPIAPGTLEQPPMTHESVVQAVSAQLQAIMSQGSSSGWTSHHKAPEQPAPEPLPAAELQMLQALLCQELGSTAARGQDQGAARLPLRGAGNTSMQHMQPAPAAATSRHHGLQIKRPAPQMPLKLDGRSSYTMQPTQRVAPISQMHRGAAQHGYAHPQHSAAMVSGAFDSQQYLAAASHAAQGGRGSIHMPMDANAQARLRAVQQQMSAPYGGADAAYPPDMGYYGGWEGSSAGDMYSMAGARAPAVQHQPLASARQSTWPRRNHGGLYWE
eukprot:jgi/Ulvmu1/5061/UM021_0078.1